MDIQKMIAKANELGIEVRKSKEGEGGFYTTETNGERRKLTTQEIIDTCLDPK